MSIPRIFNKAIPLALILSFISLGIHRNACAEDSVVDSVIEYFSEAGQEVSFEGEKLIYKIENTIGSSGNYNPYFEDVPGSDSSGDADLTDNPGGDKYGPRK